jgi:acetoin utilization deacetylase AcuC-like enzyme
MNYKERNFIEKIKNNNINFVKNNIKFINLHEDNDQILCRTAERGNINILKFIINYNNETFNIDRAFLYSIAGITFNGLNQYKICDYLLNIGADIHYDNDRPLRYAIEQKNYNMLIYLIINGINLNLIEDIKLKNEIIIKLRIVKIKKLNGYY